MGVRKKKTRVSKRRAGGYKIKTKFDKKKSKDVVHLPTPQARALWSKEKTLHENYKALGLTLDPNASVSKLSFEREREGEPVSLSDDVPDDRQGKTYLTDLLAVPEAREKKAPNLGVRERHYVKKLHDKHGDNFEAMARDVKLNFNQYTKKQLKRKVATYISTYKEAMEVQEKTSH